MNFEHQLILLIYATERNNLPNYFNPTNTNPSTFMRENESMDGVDGRVRGRFKTTYDWDTFQITIRLRKQKSNKRRELDGRRISKRT